MGGGPGGLGRMPARLPVGSLDSLQRPCLSHAETRVEGRENYHFKVLEEVEKRELTLLQR